MTWALGCDPSAELKIGCWYPFRRNSLISLISWCSFDDFCNKLITLHATDGKANANRRLLKYFNCQSRIYAEPGYGNLDAGGALAPYDYVIKWKQFSALLAFVRGIHRWPVISLHKGHWRQWWFETPLLSLWCSWNVTVLSHHRAQVSYMFSSISPWISQIL